MSKDSNKQGYELKIKAIDEGSKHNNEILLPEGLKLRIFDGESYESSADDKKARQEATINSQGIATFSVPEECKYVKFYVSLEENNTYESSPIDICASKPIKPIVSERHKTYRFRQTNQAKPLIGILKAYNFPIVINKDKNKNENKAKSKIKNEIYTIDPFQSINIEAIIYEEQKVKHNGDISKKQADLKRLKDENIKWAFKITNGIYEINRADKFPSIGEKKTPKNLNEIKKISLQDKITNFVELPYKLDINKESKIYKGRQIQIRLADLFNEKDLNDLFFIVKDKDDKEKEDNKKASNNNKAKESQEVKDNKAKDSKEERERTTRTIVFFAYYDSLPTYNIYTTNQSKHVTKDVVTSVELIILENRFSLEFDGEQLKLLENQRQITSWNARSGKLREVSNNNTSRDKTSVSNAVASNKDETTYNNEDTTKKFFYDTALQDGKIGSPLKEGNYFIKLDPKIIEKSNLKEVSYFQLFDDKKTPLIINETQNCINEGNSFEDDGGIAIANQMDSFKKSISTIKNTITTIEYIPLKVSYKKIIIIEIKRIKESLESTLAELRIYNDGEKYKNDNNQVFRSYILERPGPDSIAGEINLRVPEGRYEIIWHKGPKFKNHIKLHNDFVAKERYVLIHAGNSPKNSDGCLLIGTNPLVPLKKKVNDKEVFKTEEELKQELVRVLAEGVEGGLKDNLVGNSKDALEFFRKHIVAVVKEIKPNVKDFKAALNSKLIELIINSEYKN